MFFVFLQVYSDETVHFFEFSGTLLNSLLLCMTSVEYHIAIQETARKEKINKKLQEKKKLRNIFYLHSGRIF